MQEASQVYRASLGQAADRSAHARSIFDSLDKAKLRAVLYREQRHLCVYCEARVEEVAYAPPIEHWHPLAQEPELALEWENLYLSCRSVSTCDDLKGGRRLAWGDSHPSLPWPTRASYESWVGFTSGGEMYVRTDAPLSRPQRMALELAIEDRVDEGAIRRSVLNLNAPALVAARKAAIDSEKSRLEREFRGRTASRSERRGLASHLLEQTKRMAFISIRVAYLERRLGQGRP